jgi:hypothetical protein
MNYVYALCAGLAVGAAIGGYVKGRFGSSAAVATLTSEFRAFREEVRSAKASAEAAAAHVETEVAKL